MSMLSKIKDAVIGCLIVITIITTTLVVFIESKNKTLQQENAHKDNLIEQQRQKIDSSKTKFKRLLESMEYIDKVDVTMYNAVPNQTDDTPFITASGARINPQKASEHRWIAISRDLQERWGGPLDFGDVVYITGTGKHDGLYIVNDNMNARYENRIDILKTEGENEFAFIGEDIKLFRVKDAESHDQYASDDLKDFDEYVNHARVAE